MSRQIRDLHHGELTDDARELWARLVQERDTFPPMPPTSRLAVCPSAATHGAESCVPDMAALPAHSTCGTIVDETGKQVGGLCWCWTGCDDPDCDHPACGHRGWREFQDGWPADRDGEVIVWASEWQPWETSGRHDVLLREWRAGQHRVAKEPNPTKVLRALEGGQPVDSLRVGGGDYLALELALVDGGMKLEHRWASTTTEVSIAYAIARGRSVDELGGTITGQIRLASALTLEDAPAGYQGALFA